LPWGVEVNSNADARLQEAQQCLAKIATASEFHRFVEGFVGPKAVLQDDRILPKETAPGLTEAVLTSDIAATRFVTRRNIIRTIFWKRFSQAA
jgi:hypothetical protein